MMCPIELMLQLMERYLEMWLRVRILHRHILQINFILCLRNIVVNWANIVQNNEIVDPTRNSNVVVKKTVPGRKPALTRGRALCCLVDRKVQKSSPRQQYSVGKIEEYLCPKG